MPRGSHCQRHRPAKTIERHPLKCLQTQLAAGMCPDYYSAKTVNCLVSISMKKAVSRIVTVRGCFAPREGQYGVKRRFPAQTKGTPGLSARIRSSCPDAGRGRPCPPSCAWMQVQGRSPCAPAGRYPDKTGQSSKAYGSGLNPGPRENKASVKNRPWGSNVVMFVREKSANVGVIIGSGLKQRHSRNQVGHSVTWIWTSSPNRKWNKHWKQLRPVKP